MFVATLVVMALLTAIPMSSPDVEGARIINTFEDGDAQKIIRFSAPPQAGEYQTVYVKVRADVNVVSATMNASGLAFGRVDTIAGGGWTGYRMDLSGDIDGDGYDDFVVAAPTTGAGVNGAIYVALGSSTGVVTPSNVTLNGVTAGDRLGWGLSSGGDINNDGYDDIIGGAIEISGAGTATGSGSAYVYWGGSSPINTTSAKTLSQGANGDTFGWSASIHGDINNDGYDDVVIGAPDVLDLDGPGKAFVFLGSATGPSSTPDVTLTGNDDGDLFGFSVHICGDVNDDGYDDVLIGAPGFNGTNAADWDLGKSYVYFGHATGINTTADWTFEGQNTGDNLGQSARGAGDVNGDGYDDIMVGAHLYDTTSTDIGAVYFWYGHDEGLNNTQDARLIGTTAGGFFGWEIGEVGDANGDGYDDVAIGDPVTPNGTTAGAGAVHVYMGGIAGIAKSPVVTFKGSTANGFVGAALGPGGDSDGDGYDDVASGTRYAQQVYVQYGEGGPLNPQILLDDTEIWSWTGKLVGERVVLDFGTLLSQYVADHQNEVDPEGYIRIPFNVTFDNKGRLRVDSIRIIAYALSQPQGLDAQVMAVGNSIRLTWDTYTDVDISKMAIEMWNGTDWEEAVKVPKHNESHVITGLEDGTEYRFRIRAYDGDVQRFSLPSAEVRVTPMDTKEPETPVNLMYTEDRDLMGINISWDPSDPDVVNYEVWSNKTGEWAPLANVTAPQTWYIDSDIEDGPRYYYKVKAWDEVPLESPLSTVKWGVLEDETPPVRPSNLNVVTVPTGNALTLTWDLNTDDTVVYEIRSNKTGPWLQVAEVGVLVNTYLDRGLTDGNTYYYRIVAYDESENPSEATETVWGVPMDSVEPMAPLDLTAEARQAGSILTVKWTTNTDDTVRYVVYVYSTATSEWVPAVHVPSNLGEADVGDLTDGVEYRIRVTAFDEADLESLPSEEITGTPRDSLFPTIPIGLDIEADPRGGMLNISWSANSDDTVQYKILRWDDNLGTYVEQAVVPADQTWYMDLDLLNNKPYQYVVRAIDEAGNESPNSGRADATPKDIVPPEVPSFIDLPTITNQKDLTITGECEPGVEITVRVNRLPEDPVICDANGLFQVTIKLKNGPNEVYAVARDTSETDVESSRFTIRIDQQGPEVELTQPVTGTKGISRYNMTFEVFFDEEVDPTTMKVFMRKGRYTEVSTLLQMVGDLENVVPSLVDYNRVRSLATYEVEEALIGGAVYTVIVYDVEDLAGNLLVYDHAAFLFTFETAGGGGPDPNDIDGTDDGLPIGMIAGAVIAIVVVIVLVVFMLMRSGTSEEIEVDRAIFEAPVRREMTPEEARPDIADLYADAYEERGEDEPEHQEVEGGLTDWLSEQESASQDAEAEAKRLMTKMATMESADDGTGEIEKVPPGMLPEDEHVATAEVEEEDTGALLDELDEELEADDDLDDDELDDDELDDDEVDDDEDLEDEEKPEED
jgi:hypothetical protein